MKVLGGAIPVLAALFAGCGGGASRPPGSLVWAKRAGGPSSDEAYGVAVLSDDSMVVSGCFGGTATFGPGEADETSLTSAGSSDVFVARYDAKGTLIWAKRAGGSELDSPSGVSSSSDGSFVVTGRFTGTAAFGPGEPKEEALSSAGSADVFVARCNADGTLSWAKCAGGADFDMGYSVAVLDDGSSFVTGCLTGTATFGPSESGETILVSAGNQDVFIARYDPDGTLAWAKRVGSAGIDIGYSIVALSDGSAVVTGAFEQTMTFGSGEPNETDLVAVAWMDVFVARYNADGTLSWAKCAGGVADDLAIGVGLLSDDSVIVTGSFGFDALPGATFGLGEVNETTLVSAGGSDIFVARYDPDGTLAWAKSAGGSDMDGGGGGAGLPDGSAVVTGAVNGDATFGRDEPNETSLTLAGKADVFVARYGADGTLKWAKRAGGADYDLGCGLAVLSNGSAALTGYFEGDATFGPGEADETALTSAGAYDIFIARYNTGLEPVTPLGGGCSSQTTGCRSHSCAVVWSVALLVAVVVLLRRSVNAKET